MSFKSNVDTNPGLVTTFADSDIKIDEDRIQKIIDSLENKYTLKVNRTPNDKVVFPPGSN